MTYRRIARYIDIEPLLDAIEARGMCDIWGDSILGTHDEARIEEKKQKAIDAFIQIMKSPKNDGSSRYREWAINQALEFRCLNHRSHPTLASNKTRRRPH